ncbi:hypothetical protein POTOM_031964 [Populus tomentosa]|uniref:Epidermal patterning factor-like protein n=1 Tax=Populus tomentosa TaxID=118781 RepID=A0A8X8CT23_POPTO|nr:hypothetical protein POTOM_031964 [Populus tomentosa]
MTLLRHRHHFLSTLTFFTFLLFLSAPATTLSQLGSRVLQQGGEGRGKGGGLRAFQRVLTQKRLGGPGSSPPSCRSKCGNCSPCKAVHVAIQPGLSMPLEYYPEAWRWSFGNESCCGVEIAKRDL